MSVENVLKVIIAGDSSSLKKATKEAKSALSGFTSGSAASLQQVGKSMSDVGTKATIGLTLPLVAAGTAAVKWANDEETAFVAVKKTVNGTAEQFRKLQADVGELSNKYAQSTTEIYNVAAAAGQLGIATENIADFTDVILGLGASTNLVGEEAAQDLAKFANFTKLPTNEYRNLASAIVEVGNNSATTERDVMNMAMRIGAAGTLSGLSHGQIIGLSGALSSVGLEAEAGGTAMSRLLKTFKGAAEGTAASSEELDDLANSLNVSTQKLIELSNSGGTAFKKLAEQAGMAPKELKKFIKENQEAVASAEELGKVMGLTADQFSNLVKTNPSEALVKFFESLQQIDQSGGSVVNTLEQLGFKDVRLSDALLRASGAGDLFAKSMKMGEEAYKKNTALAKEVASALDTEAIKQKRAKQEAVNAAIALGKELSPVVTELAHGVTDLAKSFQKLSPQTKKAIVYGGLLATAFGPTAKVFGMTVGGGVKVVKFLKKLKPAAEGAAEAGGMLTKSVGGAPSALGALSTSALPAVAAVTGLAAAFGLAVYGYKKAHESIEGFNSFGSSIAAGIDSFKSKVEDATSYTADIMQQLSSSMDISGAEAKVTSSQANITTAWKTATEERRTLTQGEMQLFDTYMASLSEHSNALMEQTKLAADVLSNKLNMEKSMTLETAANYKKSAEDLYALGRTEAEKTYTAAVTEATKLMNSTVEAERIKGQAMMAEAQAQHEQHLQQLNTQYAETTSLVLQKTQELGGIDQEFLTQSSAITQQLSQLKADYATNMGTALSIAQDRASRGNFAISQIEQDAFAKRQALTEQFQAIWTQERIEHATALTAMAQDTLLHGGEIDENTRALMNELTSAIALGSEESRKKFESSLSSMVQNAASKSPELGSAASAMKDAWLQKIEEIKAGTAPIGSDAVTSLTNAINSKLPDAYNAGRSIAAAVARGANSIKPVVTVQVRQSGGGRSSVGRGSPHLRSFAMGTPYFSGGLARVFEKGGEILDLPRGTRVIPHDLSMHYANQAARYATRTVDQGARIQQYTVNLNDANIYDQRDIKTIAKEIATELGKV